MRNQFLILILILLNLLSNFLYAEAHREPSVLSTARSSEELQVIREEGSLYRKELVRDGIRTTLIVNMSSPLSNPWTYTDFAGKKSCNEENEGFLIVAYTSGNSKKAIAACAEQLEGSVVAKDTIGQTLVCKYSCKKITLDSIQSLFFESFVRYIEPNVSRRLN